jgi:catechol 2,3-dioxygenase-like lactoylglutathione lyase family enzyme
MTQGASIPSAPALDGLQHVNIPAQNLERAVTFYRDTLGLALQFREEGMAMLGNGNAAIVEGSPTLPKYFHFGWKIADRACVLAWKRKLEALGVAIAYEREESNGDLGIYFADSEGNRVEIYCETNAPNS